MRVVYHYEKILIFVDAKPYLNAVEMGRLKYQTKSIKNRKAHLS